MGGGGQLAIEGRDIDALLIPCAHQLAPDMGGAGVETKNAAIHALAEGDEPGLQGRFSLPGGQVLDATAEFSNGDGAQVEFRLVFAQPPDDLGIRSGLGKLAEDIGVNEVAHREMGRVESLALVGISNG